MEAKAYAKLASDNVIDKIVQLQVFEALSRWPWRLDCRERGGCFGAYRSLFREDFASQDASFWRMKYALV